MHIATGTARRGQRQKLAGMVELGFLALLGYWRDRSHFDSAVSAAATIPESL